MWDVRINVHLHFAGKQLQKISCLSLVRFFRYVKKKKNVYEAMLIFDSQSHSALSVNN